MENEKMEAFINDQVSMIKKDFGLTQIQDNVYSFIFSDGIPNFTINTLIRICMEVYAEIIKRSEIK